MANTLFDALVPELIRVFWINHGYYSQEEFTKLEAAVEYAKSKCFEAAFHQGNRVLGAWSPIGGFRSFKGTVA